jgi:tetratricopeptide (TPR) repeat protein
MGFCYAKLNKLAQAQECFITALDLNPKNIIAKKNLARISHAQGKKEQQSSRPPFSDLNSSQKSFPDKEAVFVKFIELAEESQKNGSIFSAIQYFEAASNIHPEFIALYLQVASCYENLHKLEKACAVYEQALSIYPEDETAQEGRKRCCKKALYNTRDMSTTGNTAHAVHANVNERDVPSNNDDDEDISEDDIIEIEE